jgi:hypothetical protein
LIAPEVKSLLMGTTATDKERREVGIFLRHRLMQETATAFTSRHGLEAYGILRIDYPELDRHPEELEALARELGWDAPTLRAFLALLLDTWLKNQILSDKTGGADTFTRIWRQGAREVTRGYVPESWHPKVLVRPRADQPKKVESSGRPRPARAGVKGARPGAPLKVAGGKALPSRRPREVQLGHRMERVKELGPDGIRPRDMEMP